MGSTGHEDALTLLGEFGLSRLEAGIYLSLLTEGEMNGYEAAKALSISRSNAYTALASLVEKGAAWVIEGSPTRYAAIPAKDLCAARLRRLEDGAERLLACLPARKPGSGSYLTVRGRDRAIDRLRLLIAGARERVYLALAGSELSLVGRELASLAASGRKVVIITDDDGARWVSTESDLTGPVVYRGGVLPGHVRAIADSQYVLTGEIGAGSDETCLYSDQANLVSLFKEAIANEIKLIELGGGS